MIISYYYPPQQIGLEKDLLFCEYTGYKFLHQTCNSDVDLIYAGSVSVLSQAVKAKEEFNKPLICWLWDIPYNWREWQMSASGMIANAPRDQTNNRRIELLKKCDLVISASKWVQKVLKEQYGIPSEQIYFYIDTKGINSIPKQKKENRITQISRYFYNKKFEHTIMATRNLKDYKTILMGDSLNSPYGKELRECSNKFNKNVIFHESINRKNVIINLKKSTILVSPSVFEGWGITPIEALYCKIPVLLSNLEVFNEIYGDSVLYHKKNDPDDMKEKIEYLLSNKKLQQKIVSDCQSLISEFTPKKFAKRWRKVIRGSTTAS